MSRGCTGQRWTERNTCMSVVEGLFVFHYPEIRHLIDLRVYLDVREEIKLKRRIKRDRDERGYPEAVVRYQFYTKIAPPTSPHLLVLNSAP